MDIIQGPNKHFDSVTVSKTEQDFYMNVYRYYDYIFTHPEISPGRVLGETDEIEKF